LFRSVSSVTTAVSYLNEHVRMIFCDPDIPDVGRLARPTP